MTALGEIKDRVRAIEEKLADGSLEPMSAREFLMALTGLSGMVGDEVRRAEMSFNHVLLSFLGGDEPAVKAKIRAQCSPEYDRYRQAKDLSDQVKQIVISCRGYLRSIDEEIRLQR
jgi:hypothetical protein